MSTRRYFRSCRLIDPEVQAGLVIRVIVYWILCVVGIALILLCGRMAGDPRPIYAHLYEMRFYYWPALLASFLLLPLVVIDVIRFTHRFAGPLLRLRRVMRQLGRGEPVEPIDFRSTDLWVGLADEFNTVLFRMRRYEAQAEADRLARQNVAESDEEGEPHAIRSAG
jgi:hypothetical protein